MSIGNNVKVYFCLHLNCQHSKLFIRICVYISLCVISMYQCVNLLKIFMIFVSTCEFANMSILQCVLVIIYHFYVIKCQFDNMTSSSEFADMQMCLCVFLSIFQLCHCVNMPTFLCVFVFICKYVNYQMSFYMPMCQYDDQPNAYAYLRLYVNICDFYMSMCHYAILLVCICGYMPICEYGQSVYIYIYVSTFVKMSICLCVLCLYVMFKHRIIKGFLILCV